MPGRTRPAAGRAAGSARSRQLAGNPEFQRLLAIQMKGRISQTYGPLFKALNLSPDQLAQFQSLLADKQQALMDVMQAARDQGINPRADPDGFKTLVNQAVSQVDQTIQQTLGDAAFQQYQQYQQTLPERNVVNSLQQQLSYTQTPLTDDQANADDLAPRPEPAPARRRRDGGHRQRRRRGPRTRWPHERRRQRARSPTTPSPRPRASSRRRSSPPSSRSSSSSRPSSRCSSSCAPPNQGAASGGRARRPRACSAAGRRQGLGAVRGH